MIAVLIAALVSADTTGEIDISLALARARVTVSEEAKPKSSDPTVARDMTYSEACSLAVRSNKPLVVFVGVGSRPIKGCVVCGVASIWDITSGVVVAVPHDGWLKCDRAGRESITVSASDKQIAEKVSELRQSLNAPTRSTPIVEQFRPSFSQPTFSPPAFFGSRFGNCPTGG